MRHLNKKIIRSFIDRELSEIKRKEVEKHLEKCLKCQSFLKNASQDIEFIKKQLDVLVPERTPSPAPPALRKYVKKETSAPFVRRLVFSSVRVPSFVLILTGSIILTLSVLLYSEV